MASQQAQGPYIGRMSPLVQQLGNERGYANTYSSFLPRPAETFTEGAFSPFAPIQPVPIDAPEPGFERPAPRRWTYTVGYNLPTGEPGTEGYKLAPFGVLKSLSKNYSIARRCIQIRKNEVLGLDWDITLTSWAEKAYQGDRAAMRDFGERRAKALKFFRKPDPNYFSFTSWMSAALEQVLSIDALSIWLCPKTGAGLRKGLLGSDLDCLWLLDGSDIRPLLDLHGGMPMPPAPAYQQYEYGVPRADLTTVIAGLDLPELAGSEVEAFRGDQLMYLPMVPSVDSPYGFGPVEQCIIPIMTGLQKQGYQLDFFRENTVPAVYISPGDASMTPNQIRELQDALNAISGDPAWHFKIIVLPPGSKTMPQKQMEIVDQADEWIANEVAMIFGVNPIDIGIMPKVSTVASPFAAREMAQASRTTQDRVDGRPMLKYFAAIPNYLLQQVCGQDDMEFSFEGMREIQDEAALTDTLVKQAQIGVRSVDEFREKLGLTPWGLEESSGPVAFTPMGPIPLADAVAIASSQAQQKALPSGTSGSRTTSPARSLPGGTNTARQRQRGGAALTPAHAASQGEQRALPERRRGANNPGSGPAHAQASVKAMHAELEALSRHLRKGMRISEWQPRWLEPRVLSLISEHLAKGMDPAGAAGMAKTLLLPPASYQWVEKAQAQQSPQAQQQALAQKYAAQIQAALASAAAAAAALIAQWAAGTLAVTAAVLALMIADLIRKALMKVLSRLWAEAWAHGEHEAGGSAGGALEAFLATLGRQVLEWVSDTNVDDIARALHDLAGLKPKKLIAALLKLLDADQRAELIAITEIVRAWWAAVLAVWKSLGVAYKGWQTRNDGKVCKRCKANQDAGFVPLDALFRSGDKTPGAHPRCRCRLIKPPPDWKPPVANKKRRRGVNLGGEVIWGDAQDGDNPAGGGGRTLYPHRADGTEVPGGVPGSSAGGEPPRWDASTPERRGYIDARGEDDAEWPDRGLGVPEGPGEDFPDGGDEDEDRWPEGGHGTAQPPVSSPGGGERGRPPNAVGKAADAAARFLADAPSVKASVVRKVMLENFPPSALAWVKRARWVAADVPLDLMDLAGRKKWAASHQTAHVNAIARDLKAGRPVNRVIGVIRPGHNHVRLIDGRHRTLAAGKAGRPVRAYIGFLDDAKDLEAAYDTYHQQFHHGDDPANKSFTAGNLADGSSHGLTPLVVQGQQAGTIAAGLAVRAADTGRVLMLQRAIADEDRAAGFWEFPGGCREDGEEPLDAAQREWAEETGCHVPDGTVTGHWDAGNGRYEGFVLSVASEDDLPVFGDRDAVTNPDDPDGDQVEALAWWDPEHLRDNPAIRPELAADLDVVLAALDSAPAAKTAGGVRYIKGRLGR